jgi:transcriptional regulator with XRE-family HTH domain
VGVGAVEGDVSERSPVCTAVWNLRHSLGETQQEFAYRMKTAIRTIARYETVRPPKGKALTAFLALAERAGRHDLAVVFQEALRDEIGINVVAFDSGPDEEITVILEDLSRSAAERKRLIERLVVVQEALQTRRKRGGRNEDGAGAAGR